MILDNITLNDLSEEERKLALSVLKQMQADESFNPKKELIDIDWKEQPVDILTFIDNDEYMGKSWKNEQGKSKMFPYWRDILVKVFPDPYHVNYNTFLESGARGLGKSEIAVLCGQYMMYKIMCMRNPYEYYDIKRTEKICFAFLNLTKDLAQAVADSKFQESIKLSPWFLARGTLSGRDYIRYVPPEPIEIIIGSQSSDTIGRAILFAFVDEISFIKNQDITRQKEIALDMIDTALGGMKTRFTRNGQNYALLVVASSKRSEQSFLETYMKDKKASEPENTYIVDEPVWNVRPSTEYSGIRFNVAVGNKFLPSVVVKDADDITTLINKGYVIMSVPVEYKAKFLEDIDRALCDFAGISSSNLSTYISGEMLSKCKTDKFKNPFVEDIIEVGTNPADTALYQNFFDLSRVDDKLKHKPLYIHFDMSLSGDKTGIAGVWIVKKKVGDNSASDLQFQLAFSVSVKAPHGWQVSFSKAKSFLKWLKANGFNIKGLSADTFQSANFAQDVTTSGFNFDTISVDRVESDPGDPKSKICKPYAFFKTCIYEQRISMYDECDLLTQEIIQLERDTNTGKVDHPVSGSKDVSDSVCGALWNASKHSEEYAYSYGETAESNLSINNEETVSDSINQIVMDFEQELLRSHQSDVLKDKVPVQNKSLLSDMMMINYGIIG